MSRRRSTKSLGPMDSFALPNNSDIGADSTLNAEQLAILQDLSVAARGSLIPSSSRQPIIPEDSNISTGELRRRFPDESQWFRRLDNTVRVSTTPRVQKNVRRHLSEDASISSIPSEEETSMPAPKGRKLFKKKKKLFSGSGPFEKALDDTALTDEPSVANETSKNLSNVSVASRRSSRLRQLSDAAANPTSPVDSPRQNFRRWSARVSRRGSQSLSQAIEGLRKSIVPTINETSECVATSSQPVPPTSEASPSHSSSPTRSEPKSGRKSRSGRRDLVENAGEGEESGASESSFVVPVRPKLFARKRTRRSIGAALDTLDTSASINESSVHETATSSKSITKSSSRSHTEDNSFEKRPRLFEKKSGRSTRRSSLFGRAMDAEVSAELSIEAGKSLENPDAGEESQDSVAEEQSIRRTRFSESTEKVRSPNNTATSSKSITKSGSRLTEDSHFEKRPRPFEKKSGRSTRRSSLFGPVMDAEVSAELSVEAGKSLENPDVGEESQDSLAEEQSIRRTRFSESNEKVRSPNNTATSSKSITKSGSRLTEDSPFKKRPRPFEKKSGRSTRRSSLFGPVMDAEVSAELSIEAGKSLENPDVGEESQDSVAEEQSIRRTRFSESNEKVRSPNNTVTSSKSITKSGSRLTEDSSFEKRPRPFEKKSSRRTRRSSLFGPAMDVEVSAELSVEAGKSLENPDVGEESPHSIQDSVTEKRSVRRRPFSKTPQKDRSSTFAEVLTEEESSGDSGDEKEQSGAKLSSKNTPTCECDNSLSSPVPEGEKEPSALASPTKPAQDGRSAAIGDAIEAENSEESPDDAAAPDPDDSQEDQTSPPAKRRSLAGSNSEKAASPVEKAPMKDDVVAPTNLRKSLMAVLANRPLVVIKSLAYNVETSTPTPSGVQMIVDSPLSSIKSPSQDAPTDSESSAVPAQSPAKNTRSQVPSQEKPNDSSEEEEELQSLVERTIPATSSKQSSASERASEKNRQSTREEEPSQGTAGESLEEDEELRPPSEHLSQEERQSSRQEVQSPHEDDSPLTTSKHGSKRKRRSSREEEELLPVIDDDSMDEDEDLPSTVERNDPWDPKTTPEQTPEKKRRSSRKEELSRGIADDSMDEDEDLPSTVERNDPWDPKTTPEQTSEKKRRSSRKEERSRGIVGDSLDGDVNSPSTVERNDPWDPKSTPEEMSKKDRRSRKRDSGSSSSSFAKEASSSSSPKSVATDEVQRSGRKSKTASQRLSALKSKKPQSHSKFDDVLSALSESEEEDDSPNESASPAMKRKSSVADDSGPRKKSRANESADQNTKSQVSENDLASAISLNPSDNFMSTVSETSKNQTRPLGLQRSAATPQGDSRPPKKTQEKSRSRDGGRLSTASSASVRNRNSSQTRRFNVPEDLAIPEESLEKSPAEESGRNVTLSRKDESNPPGDVGTPAQNNPTPSSGRVSERTPQTNERRSVGTKSLFQPTKSTIPDRVKSADIRSFFPKSTPLKERGPGDNSPDSLVPLDATKLTPIKKLSGYNGLLSEDDSSALGENLGREPPPKQTSNQLNTFNVQDILNKLHERVPKRVAPPTAPPTQPTRFQPKPAKPTQKPATKKFELILPNGKPYKTPKLLKPKKFVSDKMYRFIMKRIKNNQDIDTRVRAEQFVQRLCDTYTKVLNRKQTKPLVDDLLKDMVKLGLVSTYFEFYTFVEDFLPFSFRMKAIPCAGSNLAPEPEKGIHEKLVF